MSAFSGNNAFRLVLALLLAVGAAVFCTGIRWGLPSREADAYLFGRRQPWTGAEILRLAGDRAHDRDIGADVDRDPLHDRTGPVVVNETDARRAAIVRRYRLYTYQPDEMITMMALASMRPSEGDFDPRLYQYGGFWIYGVGALLKAASLVGWIQLQPDPAWYLDHPEQFGRFYIVARLYVVAWGLVGVWAVFLLARRLAGGPLGSVSSVVPAAAAALCFICMPVVINMAHEAKPHLPGAVLMLLAVLASARYVETGSRRWWVTACALCGAAFGMVLSALPIFVLIPMMVILRPGTAVERLTRCLDGLAIAAGIYLAGNPYIVINAINNRDLLQSNFGNSLAMYDVGRWPEGLLNAAALVGEGTSVVLATVGAAAAIFLAVRLVRGRHYRSAAGMTGLLVAAPGALILLQFIALAAGKPGEYGRFAVFPDVALALAAIAAVARTLTGLRRLVLLGAFLLVTVLPGYMYLHGFIQDARPLTSRLRTANLLQHLGETGARTIGIHAEPAPYVMPPVDLFEQRLVLLPRAGAPAEPPDILVCVAQNEPTPCDSCVGAEYNRWPGGVRPLDVAAISWANRSFDILVRSGLHPSEQDSGHASQLRD